MEAAAASTTAVDADMAAKAAAYICEAAWWFIHGIAPAGVVAICGDARTAPFVGWSLYVCTVGC